MLPRLPCNLEQLPYDDYVHQHSNLGAIVLLKCCVRLTLVFASIYSRHSTATYTNSPCRVHHRNPALTHSEILKESLPEVTAFDTLACSLYSILNFRRSVFSIVLRRCYSVCSVGIAVLCPLAFDGFLCRYWVNIERNRFPHRETAKNDDLASRTQQITLVVGLGKGPSWHD